MNIGMRCLALGTIVAAGLAAPAFGQPGKKADSPVVNPEITRRGEGSRRLELNKLELKPFQAELWSKLSDWQNGPALTSADVKGKVVLVVTYASWNKNSVKAIEFILFGTFISLVERRRAVKNYARDFEELRQYLLDTREGRAYLGKEAFLEAMTWVNEKLEKEDLVSAHVMVQTIPDDDNEDYDELKEEDTIIIPDHDHYTPTPQVLRPPTKRRRDSGSVAVAKRGGKLPAGITRQRAA